MSSSIRCQTCGHINRPTDAVCQDCGAFLTFSQPRQPSSPPEVKTTGPFPTNPASGGPHATNPFAANPYAAYPPPPQAYGKPAAVPAYGMPQNLPVYVPPAAFPVGPGIGVWRDGKILVMHKSAVLPTDRCVKCNAPTGGLRVRKTYKWHHPALAFLILAGLLIYLIVAVILRKTATVEVGLCAVHFTRRHNFLILSWVLLATGVFGFGFAAYVGEGIWALIGALLIVTAAVFGTLARPLTPKRIDDVYAWFKNAHPDYLNQLPPWPGSGNPYVR